MLEDVNFFATLYNIGDFFLTNIGSIKYDNVNKCSYITIRSTHHTIQTTYIANTSKK